MVLQFKTGLPFFLNHIQTCFSECIDDSLIVVLNPALEVKPANKFSEFSLNDLLKSDFYKINQPIEMTLKEKEGFQGSYIIKGTTMELNIQIKNGNISSIQQKQQYKRLSCEMR